MDTADDPATDDDAFAATVAPVSTSPPPPTNGPARLPEVPPEHFKPAREIARGGMGKIVAADDTRLGRPVALKVLLEPTPDAIGRFEREAYITARLQHPGIVPVYEAGRWPSGEPFFAMKLVSGQPLDKVIAAAAATLDARLALLPRVASAMDAIAYAHSQRIIHRDLKPANVLIGDYGETVVIDWGLAKDLDDTETSAERMPTRLEKPSASRPAMPAQVTSNSPTLTVAGAVMGTPAYMAPEQARGEPLDQRADVFALGAMLYHLLAGAPPYDARTATDVIAAAALGKVIPLTERERRAPPDLVAIVERAMSPLVVDRYATAGELADELRRFLTGQLVAAHHYTPVQRASRFVKRHRAAVTIATIAIVGSSIGGTMAFRSVVTARDDAERALRETVARKAAAEDLIDHSFRDMETQLRSIGHLDLLSKLGADTKAYFDRLATLPAADGSGASLDDAHRMARAIEVIGEAELQKGVPDDALKTWGRARERLAEAVGADVTPATVPHRRLIARFDWELGGIYKGRGKVTDATGYFQRSRREYAALRTEDPNDRDTLREGADTHDSLGDVLRNEGKIDQAYDEYAAAKMDREHASALPNGTPSLDNAALSKSHVKLGSIYQARGDSAQALLEYQAALRLRDHLLETEPENVENQKDVLEARVTLAEMQKQLGDDVAAIASYKSALPLVTALLHRDPSNINYQRQSGLIEAGLGISLLDSGDFRAGIAALDRAIDEQRELSARDPLNTTWQVDVSRSYTRRGDGHMYLGELDDGLADYQRALEIRKGLAAGEATSVPFRRSLAWSYAKLAIAFAERGDVAHATEAHEQALALRQQLLTESPMSSGFKNELASTQIEYGRLLLAKDAKRGGELIAAGVTMARQLVQDDVINLDWKETLTQGLTAQAEGARLAGDRKARVAALDEALLVAEPAAEHAGQNAHWPGFVAEIHVGLAETAADAATATAEWKRARDVLEPLAASGRLPVSRKALLARARARK